MIRTHSCPTCRICGSPGSYLYENFTDRLFGAPGKWSLRKCDNPECGLLWLDPMPATEDVGKLYATYYTHEVREGRSLAKRLYRRAIDGYLRRRYGYETAISPAAFDWLLVMLLYLHPGARAEADARVMGLPAKPGGRLLEVGFGSGQTLRRMRSLGWDVQGVEFDPVAVNNALASGLNVHLGDLASQKFAEECFDAVVSSHVIEHLPDPEGFLNECRRLLKPGGTLVIYTPNSRSFGHCLFGRNWRGLEPPRHLHLFNSDNLPGMIRRTGLSDISCRTTVRGGSVLMASWYLSRNPRIHTPLKGISRLLEEATHYLSWAACRFNKELGEELLLISRKAGGRVEVDHRAADLEAPLVHIVILNWNGWPLTLECLRTVEALDYPNYRVLVVDNGSTDDSVARLKEVSPTLELIVTGENLGFTGGCNVGITKSLAQGAEYVLLFNNDAKAAPGMLSRMVCAAIEADAAICGARVMDEAGQRILFDGRSWPAHIFGVEPLFLHTSINRWSLSDGVDGCAMLVCRDILEQRLAEYGHIFDPEFFMYCEETDFCRYGVSRGYRCIVSHEAIAYHGLAKSSGGGGNPRSYYYLTRNRIYLANRWLSPPWKIFFHLYYLPSRLLLQFRRTPPARSAVWQGLRDGYLGVKGIWNRHGG